MNFSKPRHILILFILIVNSIFIDAQIKDVGLPFVQNYTRKDYNAAAQNWSITQDNKGVVYFGNNEGLLSYNGVDWKTYPLPNSSIVRSVKSVGSRIYVGGYNELGYFELNQFGELIYHSITEQLPDKAKNFDEIWRIFETEEGVVFQSYYYLFVYSQDGLSIVEPKSTFGFSYQINETIYIIDKGFGLYAFKDNRLTPIVIDEHFFNKNEINFLMQFQEDELLLGSTNKGLYRIKEKELIEWTVPITAEFKKHQVFTGINLGNEQIAIGTTQNGIYILDYKGHLVMHLNRNRKLLNNTVLSIFQDRYENLWLGLDNGIAYLEVNSPMTLFDYSYNIETSYDAMMHNDYLYIGTNQGLFTKKKDKLRNEYLLKDGFNKVKGTLGQVWKLEEQDDALLCGHNYGAFLINQGMTKTLSSIPGAWDFEKVPWDSRYLIGGYYNGLNLYFKGNKQSQWKYHSVFEGFNESCKEISFDHLGNLWISHAIKGLFRVNFNQELSQIAKVKKYRNEEGLPDLPYRLCKLDGKMFVLAQSALYEFVSDKKGFERNERYSKLFNEIDGLSYVEQEPNGDIWYFAQGRMGVYRLQEDGTTLRIDKPFCRINNQFLSGSYENVTSIGEHEYLIGSQDGMLHYKSDKLKNFDFTLTTYLKKVLIESRGKASQDSVEKKMQSLKLGNTVMPYKYNSISFYFFTAYFEGENALMHSYRLTGYDNAWTDWENITSKNYDNLPDGDYVFEVKAMNVYEMESQMAQFRFTIKPPFYKSRTAYVIYFLLIAMAIFLNFFFYKQKIERARKNEAERMEEEQQELIKEVEQSEEKILKLQEEKMASEMRLKNIELANSTMNLVQKNKLLTRIKRELVLVSDKAKSNAVKADVADLIKRIDKDINNDKNLKLFDEYFDRVHQDFLKRLKGQHPQLTPKDMRLCAYLRMNIVTKEIAPLMNVSIRGLEISRYRLRKKLDLDREDNLVEYIMGL